ncbi:hypothetical protein [Ruegeria profundi]|uniref:hypothetical protein n=1 Tax=Ruegeria profundi TaxID=1685378 RepID=UPI003C7D85B7
MKTKKLPNPLQKAIDKLLELDLAFSDLDIPESAEAPNFLEIPASVFPLEAPVLLDISLPKNAMADIEIPAAVLPSDVFDLGGLVQLPEIHQRVSRKPSLHFHRKLVATLKTVGVRGAGYKPAVLLTEAGG